MNTNYLKTQISQLLPSNFAKLISALRHRQANDLIIDFFWGIVGDKDLLETTDKTDLVSAINEILHGAGGFNPTWLDMQHAYTVIDFPAMNKGEVRIVRVQEQGSNLEVEDGWATIGGMNGVKIGNRAMLVCMQNSAGGALADVGYKYAIVGNQIPAPQIITVADYASLPDEVDAILGVIYLTIDTGNIYYFDASAGDYMQIGSVIEGELIDEFNFIDTNNNPVVPDGTHLYKDIINTPEKYYKWNGVKYEPFDSQGGQQILFYQFVAGAGAPPYASGFEGVLYVNQTTGEVYIWDGSQFVGSGGGGEIFEEVTKTQLDNLIANSELVSGMLYKITEVETWMKQGDTTKAIYLHAISTNELEKKGTGEFYVPKYNQGVSGYDIWSGKLWQKTSGAMGTEPSYSINDVVIWGGKHWKNLTGNYGTFIDHYELDSVNWEEIPVNDTDYNVRTNIIEYDYANDMITYRKDDAGNEISTSYKNWKFWEDSWFNGDPLSNSNYNPIKAFQWGNEFDTDSYVGVGFNIVENGVFECVNQRGNIYRNTLNGGRIYNNTLNNGAILDNTIGIDGYIGNNTLNNGYIRNNTIGNSNGSISNNTIGNNGSIRYNTLNDGSISNNTIGNNGSIGNNTLNDGSISNNTIGNNGSIRYNTLNDGRINFNTLDDGNILNYGSINNNTLNGGYIRLGLSNPISSKQLQYLTINTGDIGGNSGIDLSSATLVYQEYERIVFKNSAGVTKIRYYDGSGSLVIADLTD